MNAYKAKVSAMQCKHYLILASVDEGYRQGLNDVGYWNFIHIPLEREDYPDGVMIVAASQQEAMETYVSLTDRE